jgi:acetylornithine deacetylase/succinyl-diaminopimelate desuccinylase-like protein
MTQERAMVRKFLVAAAFLAALPLQAQDQRNFRALYQELVETNTTLSVGDCTLAATKLAARLKTAGFTDAELTVFTPPDHPKEGGLIAVYPGSDPAIKPMLLLAHLDVVEAKREDWSRDPFTLIEENGQFYGRGTSDDKAQAAIWTEMLIRFHMEGYHPKRGIKMALTCGEEGAPFNGAFWLTQNHKDWIDAAFALNEGGGGKLDEKGRPEVLTVEAAEKSAQNYRLEVTNPGGHSSRPVKDNAIYHLAHALVAVENLSFPFQLIDANRGYFSGLAKQLEAQGDRNDVADMRAMVASPPDLAAAARLAAKDPSWNTTLRTTCVATMLDGGHAPNALPQRAGALINCRIFPGIAKEAVRDDLLRAINDPAVSVTILPRNNPPTLAAAPPLTRAIMQPIETLAHEMWPGVPVLPSLVAGATDGRFLNAIGIPTYGVDGAFSEPAGNNAHGLNEHMLVKSLYQDRDFLYRLVKLYAEQ